MPLCRSDLSLGLHPILSNVSDREQVRIALRCVTREKAAFRQGSEAAREIQMLIVRQELIAKQQDSALAHEQPQRTADGFRGCVTAGQVQTADFGYGLPRKRAHVKTRIGTRHGIGAKHLIGSGPSTSSTNRTHTQ